MAILLDERVTITLSGAGVTTGTVTVDVTDDTPVALTLPPSAVSVSEGSTQTFTVELASVPAAARHGGCGERRHRSGDGRPRVAGLHRPRTGTSPRR